MKKAPVIIWAEKIAKQEGFKISKKIYQGEYYSKANLRNVIYAGKYEGKDAILKVYDDPRMCKEGESQRTFEKVNKSKKIISPKLYKHKIISANAGWLIMEKLPPGGSFFSSPLNEEERSMFLDLYYEYRKNYPTKPTRDLHIVEKLPANKFHLFRISRWFELANNKEAELILKKQKPTLDEKEFMPRYLKILEIIDKEFANRKMVWCHGHFKPQEIYCHPKLDYSYLTDHAHNHIYPEGYEFGFIIWADWLVTADWKMDYKKWQAGVKQWIEDIRPIAKKLGIKNYNSLIRASIMERIIGSILADITASDKPRSEKLKRIEKLYKLFDWLETW